MRAFNYYVLFWKICLPIYVSLEKKTEAYRLAWCLLGDGYQSLRLPHPTCLLHLGNHQILCPLELLYPCRESCHSCVGWFFSGKLISYSSYIYIYIQKSTGRLGEWSARWTCNLETRVQFPVAALVVTYFSSRLLWRGVVNQLLGCLEVYLFKEAKSLIRRKRRGLVLQGTFTKISLSLFM